MTSPTETEIPVEDVPGVVKALFSAVLGSTDNGKFYAIESASSPQSSRSGTSSRSLRGLAKSGLVAYLPALLVGANAQIQTFLDRGIFGDGSNGRTTP